jgi:hypothetical protein
VYGRHVPETTKTQLLTVRQQLNYNDLTFFRKCLDGDADMDAMARITTGRVMRNTDGEHRLIPPRARTDLDRYPLVLFPARHTVEFPPTGTKILSRVPLPKIVLGKCDVSDV